jgi:hypothetical protein
MKRLAGVALFCLALAPPLRADTYPRQPWVDAVHYRFALELSDSSPEITTGEPVRLPLEIGIVATPGALPRIEKAELTGRTGTFTFTADATPASVALDPNAWLLFEAGAFTKG